MSISHLLEDFTDAATGNPVTFTDVMLEEQKLAAFEKGYQAGWDDSAEAQKDSATRISEDFASNIRDLSFTYEEAYGAFINEMAPVIRQIVDAVLPKLAHDTLGLRVAEMLQDEIKAHGRQPVSLKTAPGSADALRELLPDGAALPIEINEDTSLTPGQVRLGFGSMTEREVDLEKVLKDIATAVDGFFQETAQQFKETA